MISLSLINIIYIIMLKNIIPPGPRTEKGKTIRVVNHGNSLVWFNSNKVVVYDTKGNVNEIFPV